MKILILGAGRVGATLTEHLAQEYNDITVIDTDMNRLRELHDRCEISILTGYASHPAVLAEAGGETVDMLIAVTNNDEINMMACQVAHSLFATPIKIARVRSSAYSARRELFSDNNIPIDVLISPEQVVTTQIRRLIDYPGALQVIDFYGGILQLVAIRVDPQGPLTDRYLRNLHEDPKDLKSWVSLIYREGKAFIPNGYSRILNGDELFFFTARQDIRNTMARFQPPDLKLKRVFIAGGGRIGERLALSLEFSHRVKIIELDAMRCQLLAERLETAVILNGTATSQQLLIEENIDDCDIFCALTDDDEVNVMSSMLAKRLGARKVLALINNPAYVDLLQGGDIDIAISPEQATISGLLAHVRRGNVLNVQKLRHSNMEAIEIIIENQSSPSKVIGKAIKDLPLPDGISIGAIVRDDQILFAKPSLVIEDQDHVILLAISKQKLREVEKLFKVSGFLH